MKSKQKVKVPAIEAEIAPESSPEEGEEEEKEEVEIKQEAEEVDIKFQTNRRITKDCLSRNSI